MGTTGRQVAADRENLQGAGANFAMLSDRSCRPRSSDPFVFRFKDLLLLPHLPV